jgi:hypothetical protein
MSADSDASERGASACVGLVDYWWPGPFQGDKAAVAGPQGSLVRVRVPSSSPHHGLVYLIRGGGICTVPPRTLQYFCF